MHHISHMIYFDVTISGEVNQASQKEDASFTNVHIHTVQIFLAQYRI